MWKLNAINDPGLDPILRKTNMIKDIRIADEIRIWTTD